MGRRKGPIRNRMTHGVSLRGRRAGKEQDHEFREIHRTRARLRAIGAVAGHSRGPPAIHPGTHPEGPARRRGGSGRRPDRPRRRQFARQAFVQTELALGKLPKVQGAGAGQLYLAPTTARIFDSAEKIAQKAGDSYVTVERLLLALAMEKSADAGKILEKAGVTRKRSTRRSRNCARAAPPTTPRPRTPMTR
jgi:hypothetical protein